MKYLKSISVIYRLVTISSFNLTSNNIFHMMILLQKFNVFVCITHKKMINKQLSKQWLAHDFFGNSPLPPSCTYDFSYITNQNFKAGLIEQSVLKVEKQCNTKSVQKWLQQGVGCNTYSGRPSATPHCNYILNKCNVDGLFE